MDGIPQKEWLIYNGKPHQITSHRHYVVSHKWGYCTQNGWFMMDNTNKEWMIYDDCGYPMLQESSFMTTA